MIRWKTTRIDVANTEHDSRAVFEHHRGLHVPCDKATLIPDVIMQPDRERDRQQVYHRVTTLELAGART